MVAINLIASLLALIIAIASAWTFMKVSIKCKMEHLKYFSIAMVIGATGIFTSLIERFVYAKGIFGGSDILFFVSYALILIGMHVLYKEQFNAQLRPSRILFYLLAVVAVISLMMYVNAATFDYINGNIEEMVFTFLYFLLGFSVFAYAFATVMWYDEIAGEFSLPLLFLGIAFTIFSFIGSFNILYYFEKSGTVSNVIAYNAIIVMGMGLVYLSSKAFEKLYRI